MMKKKTITSIFLLIFSVNPTICIVPTVSPGQSVWGVNRLVAQTADIIESKVDNVIFDVSVSDTIMISQLDVVESKLDTVCDATILTSDDVSAGTITLSTAGNYCLGEDITADIDITGASVTLDLNDRCLTGVIDLSNDNARIMNGKILPPAPSSAPAAAIALTLAIENTFIKNVVIDCDNSTGVAVDGRDCLLMRGFNTQLIDCSLFGGDASSGDAGTSTGATGGFGIVFLGERYSLIKGCIIKAGNGGDATLQGGATGGLGGRGCEFSSSFSVVMVGCKFIGTGKGGDGDAGSGTGGLGGPAILINNSNVDLSVHHCTFENTGAGGSGASGAVGGYAIQDNELTVSSRSIIYSNFAHNVLGSPVFRIRGGNGGIQTPNPPTSTDINSFANVYV